ncbi:exosortase A [Qipengyuania spongiae]|uniref:Exosortase A n=1 Tax=Qipengyuania spongiae TaxID=2909673 RepID=A0ABY5SWQ7_9SPHN|nr:exosortase A [Qipengyuania spongiae]UVI38983.1 exosortase A [Qipengyuania spongiae]
MQPDSASQQRGLTLAASSDWHRALTMLVIAAPALVLLAMREWGEMAHQWWNIATYSHILLIPFIVGWLAWDRRADLARISPQTSWIGVTLFVAACALWVAGRASGINLLAHAGGVGMLQAAILAILGVRAAALLALPLGMMVFLVPFGQEIVPPMQAITARLAIVLTHWSGVPAETNGIFINTPAGLFVVAEACSGVNFLIAAFAIGVLVCFTAFDSWARRAAFMAASILVPILANGVRAWGTIYVAQSQGIEFAAGFDHIVYGWIFFAIVLAILIGGARPFFQRVPEEAGLSVEETDRNPIVRTLQRGDGRFGPVFTAMALIAVVTAIAASQLGG